MTSLPRTSAVLLTGAIALMGAVMPAAPAVATASSSATAAPALRYEVGAVVPDVEGGATAMAMNENGGLAGTMNYSRDAFTWSADGEFQTLPGLPDRVNNVAQDLNDSGMAAGI